MILFQKLRIKANDGWKGFQGYITAEMIASIMPKPSDDVLICTCGPFEMNRMVAQQLGQLGYKEENVFKF